MADKELVNLNARIPRRLMRQVKLHTTARGLLMRRFITDAIAEKLHPKRARRPKGVQTHPELGALTVPEVVP
jgi:hypothetical protein